jgi:2-keto-4-pentenoate hydratase/2-oxohepta-3-ene-1,7-dioic acid hydratase in catechol pathway
MTKFVRYRAGSHTAYGIEEDGAIAELEGTLFAHKPTGVRRKLEDVKLLHPCTPGKILAVGRNFKSHFGDRPHPKRPELFYKPISCLQDPGGPIVIPHDSTDLHHEGELVLVIGKRVRHASRDEARDAIFGVTCGNDVSERFWQMSAEKDIQWWRAKGCDTFGPLGPAVVTGLNPDNLQLTVRLNGEVVQDQSTADFIFDSATAVSFVSRYLTLEQGDILFTGTPGTTRPMHPGDAVEVEIEGIGVLSNPVAAES